MTQVIPVTRTPAPVPLAAVQPTPTERAEQLRLRLDEVTQDVRELQAMVGQPRFSRADEDFLRDQIKLQRRRRVEIMELLGALKPEPAGRAG